MKNIQENNKKSGRLRATKTSDKITTMCVCLPRLNSQLAKRDREAPKKHIKLPQRENITRKWVRRHDHWRSVQGHVHACMKYLVLFRMHLNYFDIVST